MCTETKRDGPRLQGKGEEKNKTMKPRDEDSPEHWTVRVLREVKKSSRAFDSKTQSTAKVTQHIYKWCHLRGLSKDRKKNTPGLFCKNLSERKSVKSMD